MRAPRREARPAAPAPRAVQLRLALAPACEWHQARGAAGGAAPPCPRDAQVRVTDPVRGLTAVCCAAHGLALADVWRHTVPNRRRNVTRIRAAWLPDAPRYVTPPRAFGARRAA